MSKLVIVESPAKAKTIAKYLGRGYSVMASMGHLRDLPKSTLGVDIEAGFEPRYITIKGKTKLARELKDKVRESSEVFLATDPDREGEAISWHLEELLGLDAGKPNRVTFNEITQKAVKAGIKSPRRIDMDLVDAQQARRVLDRIVGYKLSPLLWKKIRRGLSAGRVQSVATRLVVDRENEIREFNPVEYWTLAASLSKTVGKTKPFTAKFFGNREGKIELSSREETELVLSKLEGAEYTVDKIKKAEKNKQPAPPFITSTLQQEASRRLGFPVRKTMMAAQQLYEGIEISGHGLVGLITYMRTDSLRLSDDIVAEARTFIGEKYGDAYVPPAARTFKSKAGSQDAHEAIRPTDVRLLPEEVKKDLTPDQYKLYKLIWERFTACQMSPAVLDTVTADIGAAEYIFRASGYTVKFPGFTVLYEESSDSDEKEDNTALPEMNENELLNLLELTHEQRFTQPPSRYTEASLIRAMEENGIGRPSTYAPTIGTIMDRGYVQKEGKTLLPTALGEIVTGLMKDKFMDIVDVEFTARLEDRLDSIEEGKQPWKKVLEEFYQKFADELLKAEEELREVSFKIPDEETDVVCENCGRNMVVKSGRFGKFLACPGYPECKNTKPIAQETGGLCPLCGGKVLQKKSKNNNKYFGCENNPKCAFMTWDQPLKDTCPKCGKTLFRKYSREEKKIYCAAEGCGYEIPYESGRKKKKTGEEG